VPIPLRWSPTPVVVPVQVVPVLEGVLAGTAPVVGVGNKTFLQEVLPAPAAVHCRRYIATHRSAL